MIVAKYGTCLRRQGEMKGQERWKKKDRERLLEERDE